MLMLRSCSLPCFKTHQSQCQSATGGVGDVGSGPVPDGKTNRSLVEGAEVSVAASTQSVRREDVDQMFAKYPMLRSKLKAIYDSYGNSEPSPGNGYTRKGRFETGGSEEKAFSREMALLQRELGSESTDAEDLRAFAAYVAMNSG